MKANLGDVLAALCVVLLMFTPLLDAWITFSAGVILSVVLVAYHVVRGVREINDRRRRIEIDRREATVKKQLPSA